MWQWYIQLPGRSSGIQAMHGAARRKVDDVLPGAELRRLAVDRQDLEEEAVQVERVIHEGGIHDVPHLKLADLHRLVVVVSLAIDEEVETVAQAHTDAELHLLVRRRVRAGERFDRAQASRDRGARRLLRSNLQRAEPLVAAHFDGAAEIAERFDRQRLTLFERTDEQVDAVGRWEQHFRHFNGRFDQTAVHADDPEPVAMERQTDIARTRRIDDPPALDLSATMVYAVSGHAQLAFDSESLALKPGEAALVASDRPFVITAGIAESVRLLLVVRTADVEPVE